MAFPTNPIYKILKERAAGTDPDGNVITPQVTAIIKYLGIEGHYLEIPLNENNTDLPNPTQLAPDLEEVEDLDKVLPLSGDKKLF